MAIARKFRNNWVADYIDQYGKRHREKPEGNFENMAQQRRAAQSLLKKRLDEVDRGSYSADSARLTFGQVAAAFLESKVNIRPSTRRNYRSLIDLYLAPYFGTKKLRHISVADIECFRNDLSVGRPPPIVDAFAMRMRNERPALSQARARQRASMKAPGIRTINKAVGLLGSIFRYACKHEWINRNPAEYVEKLKVPVSLDSDALDSNVLAPSEIVRLLDAAEPSRWSKDGKTYINNYRLLIKTAVFTGMRSGEIRGLKWGDIDWASGQIHVRRSYKEGHFNAPKTQASIRQIELPGFLLAELREWRLACPKGKHDLVFPNLAGNPMSNTNLLQRGFYPALRRAGLRKIRFHDLRHTFASMLIAGGEDIVRVSRLLGHASPTITLQVYAHMLPNEHYGSADRLASLVFDAVTIVPADCDVKPM